MSLPLINQSTQTSNSPRVQSPESQNDCTRNWYHQRARDQHLRAILAFQPSRHHQLDSRQTYGPPHDQITQDTRTHSPQSVPQVGYRTDTSRLGPTENEILNRQLHCLVPSHMTRTNDQTIQSLSSSRHPQQTIIPFHLPGQSPHLHSLVPSPNIVPQDDLIAARPFSGGKCSSRTIVDHVPHVPGDAHHTVGSAKHREASKKRRKNAAKFFCPYVESCRDSTFTARHNLEKHLNSHKAPEEKELYACESCPKIYPYKCNLNRHKEKVHSNTKRRKPYEPSQKK